MDAFYAKREKETTIKRDDDRAKFIEKIRNGFQQNQQVKDYYNNLYADLAQKERQFEQNIIDIPAREKMIRDQEMQRRKEMERATANSQNINFIKNQMDERSRLKREWDERDAIETKNLTDRAVNR